MSCGPVIGERDALGGKILLAAITRGGTVVLCRSVVVNEQVPEAYGVLQPYLDEPVKGNTSNVGNW
jgi:hypothetical protein